MTQKKFLKLAGGIFFIIAVLHGARLVYHWEMLIAGRMVPLWASGVGVAVAGWLALTGFKLATRGGG